jgi:hypothetical protein
MVGIAGRGCREKWRAEPACDAGHADRSNIRLTTDSSVMTAISNDYSYEAHRRRVPLAPASPAERHHRRAVLRIPRHYRKEVDQ